LLAVQSTVYSVQCTVYSEVQKKKEILYVVVSSLQWYNCYCKATVAKMNGCGARDTENRVEWVGAYCTVV
jgi:hypothetical protein